MKKCLHKYRTRRRERGKKAKLYHTRFTIEHYGAAHISSPSSNLCDRFSFSLFSTIFIFRLKAHADQHGTSWQTTSTMTTYTKAMNKEEQEVDDDNNGSEDGK